MNPKNNGRRILSAAILTLASVSAQQVHYIGGEYLSVRSEKPTNFIDDSAAKVAVPFGAPATLWLGIFPDDSSTNATWCEVGWSGWRLVLADDKTTVTPAVAGGVKSVVTERSAGAFTNPGATPVWYVRKANTNGGGHGFEVIGGACAQKGAFNGGHLVLRPTRPPQIRNIPRPVKPETVQPSSEEDPRDHEFNDPDPPLPIGDLSGLSFELGFRKSQVEVTLNSTGSQALVVPTGGKAFEQLWRYDYESGRALRMVKPGRVWRLVVYPQNVLLMADRKGRLRVTVDGGYKLERKDQGERILLLVRRDDGASVTPEDAVLDWKSSRVRQYVQYPLRGQKLILSGP